jgi:hypothetical protein
MPEDAFVLVLRGQQRVTVAANCEIVDVILVIVEADYMLSDYSLAFQKSANRLSDTLRVDAYAQYTLELILRVFEFDDAEKLESVVALVLQAYLISHAVPLQV